MLVLQRAGNLHELRKFSTRNELVSSILISGSPQPGAGIVKTVIIRTIPIMSPTASPQNAPASFVLSQNIAITNKTALISSNFPPEFYAAKN